MNTLILLKLCNCRICFDSALSRAMVVLEFNAYTASTVAVNVAFVLRLETAVTFTRIAPHWSEPTEADRIILNNRCIVVSRMTSRFNHFWNRRIAATSTRDPVLTS